ncbi:substrate-binding periplasmic protein [Ramlibacter sp. MAHUQ-53]|uniref:substrate-binding periplasmic protein n=1 Tax=unclassified Ramlibacter TaxID=2617605 RepID=UPI00362DFFDB
MALFRYFLVLALFVASLAARATDRPLRVAVLDSSVPMSYRDAKGELTGFTIGIIRAVCEELRATCTYKVITLDKVIDGLLADEFDIAAIGLLDTPERRAKVLLSKPFFRSRSIWFTKRGVRPGAPGARVAVVAGSAQEAYVRSRGWVVEPLRSNDQVAQVLQADLADAGLVPMPTAIALIQQPGFEKLGLMSQALDAPGLGGDACFAISPRQPELKVRVDAALDRIRRDGRHDKINSQFLPFRID